MRLNHEAVNQTAKELLLAKASNLRTPKSCVDAIAKMTPAEVIALCLYLVSHTPSTHQSCAYMTSLTHYLSDWTPSMQNFILEVKVCVTTNIDKKLSESEVLNAVQEQLSELDIGDAQVNSVNEL